MRIEAAFIPQVETFFEEMSKRMPDSLSKIEEYSIRFDDESPLATTVLGQCEPIGGTEIVISRANWDTLDYAFRDALIFHELGHCRLGRYHEFIPIRQHTCPSYMTGSLIASNCGYDLYSPMWREFYFDELFGVKTEPDWIYIGIDIELNAPLDTFFSSTDVTNSILLNVEQNYQVQLSFAQKDSLSFSINGYKINFAGYNGDAFGGMQLFDKSNRVLNYDIMNLPNTDAEDSILFTLRIMNNQLYYYINHQLIHNREFTHADILDISIQKGIDFFEQVVVSKWE